MLMVYMNSKGKTRIVLRAQSDPSLGGHLDRQGCVGSHRFHNVWIPSIASGCLMVWDRARTEHATVPGGGHSLRTAFFHANSIVAFFPQSLHTRVLAIQAHITPTIAVNVSHFGSKTAQSPGTGCHKAPPPPPTSLVKTEKNTRRK